MGAIFHRETRVMPRPALFFLAGVLAVAAAGPGYADTPAAVPPNAAHPPLDGMAPAGAMQQVGALIHAGKYATARTAVLDLLATYPRDPRLPKAKEILEGKLVAELKQLAAARARPAPETPVELGPDDQANFHRLIELTDQAKKTSDPARQRALLQQFMNESGTLAQKHPRLFLLWAFRAASALVLDDPPAGYEAGQKLLALGAAESKKINVLQLLVLLKDKGWQDAELVRLAVEAATYTPGNGHTTKLNGNLAMDFVWIPPGTFEMGSPKSEPGRSYNEGPQTTVTISQGFWLGKTPVTQAQYQALIGDSPNYYKEAGTNSPVSHLEWADAREYCRRLTIQERAAGRLPTGFCYCLPSEAEWEYACRAGTTGARYADALDAIAWYSANNRSGVVQPVQEKQPNAWGLHDMLGGGWEWCSDWYGPYAGIPVTDPMGPDSGKGHICRGTYPYDDAINCRAAKRNWSDHAYAYSSFRVAICAARQGRQPAGTD